MSIESTRKGGTFKGIGPQSGVSPDKTSSSTPPRKRGGGGEATATTFQEANIDKISFISQVGVVIRWSCDLP